MGGKLHQSGLKNHNYVHMSTFQEVLTATQTQGDSHCKTLQLTLSNTWHKNIKQRNILTIKDAYDIPKLDGLVLAELCILKIECKLPQHTIPYREQFFLFDQKCSVEAFVFMLNPNFKICDIMIDCTLEVILLFDILRQYKNKIWSIISATYDQHLQLVFSSTVKIKNQFHHH